MVSSLPPFAVPTWMNKLKNGAYMSNKILERCLLSYMTCDEASQAVDAAIRVGILEPKRKVVSNKNKRISLCFSQKLEERQISSENDPYCFECHLPGNDAVKKCLFCVRSFHAACMRKNPRRPNYSVPSDKGQTYRFPLNESDMEEEASGEEVIPNEPPIIGQDTTSYELDYNSNINETPHDSLKREADSSSDDIFFVSEQPARQRKRCSPSVKSEEIPNEPNNNEQELCTPCRILRLADLLNPPHMSVEELNCLLGYSWQKHHSWMKNDVRKYMSKHWNSHDANLVKIALFKNDVLGLSDIAHSIENKKFKHLSELLIDLLDLQHNIGVFFGTSSEEFNATKWLLRDITHDIREISRCSDCYRHSNESNRSPFWFAKPCTQRHELVYAKQYGSPHWPAKVIRVMAKKNTIYDVRFFGGSHSRALISARDILPIDADRSLLKIKVSRTFKAAMRELRCHMLLMHQPMYLFNFYADPLEVENVINHALPHCIDAELTPSPAKKRKVTRVGATTPKFPQRIQPLRSCSISQRPDTLQDITVSVTSSPTFDVQTPMSGYHDLVQEIFVLNEELSRNKTELDNLKQQLNEVKRKRWCQHCLKEASFDCCFTASYCSDVCKRRDKKRHQTTCGLAAKS